MEPIAVIALYTLFLLRKYLMPKWFTYELTDNPNENIKILYKVIARTETLFFIVNSSCIFLIIKIMFPEEHAEHTVAILFLSMSISYGLLAMANKLLKVRDEYKNLVWAIIFSTLALISI